MCSCNLWFSSLLGAAGFQKAWDFCSLSRIAQWTQPWLKSEIASGCHLSSLNMFDSSVFQFGGRIRGCSSAPDPFAFPAPEGLGMCSCNLWFSSLLGAAGFQKAWDFCSLSRIAQWTQPWLKSEIASGCHYCHYQYHYHCHYHDHYY